MLLFQLVLLLHRLVVAAYIAEAGTHIVSFPAILTAAVALLSTPVPLGFKFISTLVSPVAERIGPFLLKH